MSQDTKEDGRRDCGYDYHEDNRGVVTIYNPDDDASEDEWVRGNNAVTISSNV